VKAEVITIGTELLLGEITDTNATAIAQQLRAIGLDLIYRTTVGDNENRIAEVIDAALNRVDIVITSGGLGPTVDDVTREAIARATGRPLEYRPELMEQIAERFKRFNVRMSENNRRQAHVPRGAVPIENPVGTAPIFILETERGTIIVLPGVPGEMRYLMDNEVIPWLKTRIGAPAVILSRVLRTAGIGESQIDQMIGDMMTATNPTVGLAAHTGQTDIRITAKAQSAEAAEQMIAPVEVELRKRLGTYIYGTGSDLLEDIVIDLLNQHRSSVASVEVCAEGVLSSRFCQAGRRHDCVSNCTTFSQIDDLLSLSIDVQHPLAETAVAAAENVRRMYGSTFGLALLIDKRPQEEDEGTGAAIAVASESASRVRTFNWTERRTNAGEWAATHALAMLRRMLLNLEVESPQTPA
jgi:competence/damage-inducible protein CinA-like protein